MSGLHQMSGNIPNQILQEKLSLRKFVRNTNNPPLKRTPTKNTSNQNPHILVKQTDWCYILGSPKPPIRKPSETPTHSPLNHSSFFSCDWSVRETSDDNCTHR